MDNKNNIVVKGIEVSYKRINEDEYICLTDIARYKNEKEPKDVIKNWMRLRSTIEYLALWEKFYNENFKGVEIDPLLGETGKNTFTLSPSRWIEEYNAIGLKTIALKNGGTYAHKDIAFKFASWISVEFEFYLIKEFQRLKEKEYKSMEWNAKRELAKVNYKLQTTAIKENLIVPELTKDKINYVYASEADLLNVALFGKTASEWRKDNKDLVGNMRDYASIEQLLVLANMESYNSILIEKGMLSNERIVLLNEMARNQMRVLIRNDIGILDHKEEK